MADQQELELEALRAIYSEDFINCPPPKVWKGAQAVPEFKIRVKALEPLDERVHFFLRVKFPKTYPRVLPILAIEEPIGLSKTQANQLLNAIKTEGQKALGEVMVFQLVTFSQEWITNHHTLSTEGATKLSLAEEMENRATQQQREEAQRVYEEEERRRRQDVESTANLARQIGERKEEKRRRRTLSNVTDGMYSQDYEQVLEPANIHTFNWEIKCLNFLFTSVALSNVRAEGVGMTYRADPDCDHQKGLEFPVLEVHRVLFDHQHYKSPYGRKKIADIERELKKLQGIQHPNLETIFATSLDFYNSIPRLTILLEQRSSVTLKDVLMFSDGLRQERALDYMKQILTGLGELHAHNICHRGLTADCITLTPFPGGNSSRLKIRRCSYYTRIFEQHRSNNIVTNVVEDWSLPQAWMPPEALDHPLEYPISRDIWCAGVILVQMLRGFDIINRFDDWEPAVDSDNDVNMSVKNLLAAIFIRNRKRSPSCSDLCRQLSHIPGPLISSSSSSVPIPDVKTPLPRRIATSPENGYFNSMRTLVAPRNRASRYKEDWEELEFLGKGGFGAVVKARNKLDGRIYAIKKVKLRGTENDDKIFREVNALSRLNHRYIVRYYSTWLETVHTSRRSSIDSDSGSGTEDSDTTPSRRKAKVEDDPFHLDFDDLTRGSISKSRSFPSIHFGDESSKSQSLAEEEDESSSEEEEADVETTDTEVQHRVVPRVLYIQMEFVEQQTLRELVVQGLSEERAWELFRQVLEAVVHISSLGILHRDIKLSNIFIDSKGDVKLGDFGLATSSLAAVDPSDVEASRLSQSDGEMTSGVGTSLYVAPEVLHSRGRNHNKADMYSLGIVFFEMNYKFNTASERIAVLQQLRHAQISFPPEFTKSQQKELITWLLQHDPSKRPTAAQALGSPHMPQQMEDAYFAQASRLMANPNSPHYTRLMNALFTQPVDRVRDFLYDDEERPEHTALDTIVEDRLIECFQLHGAVSMDPLLFVPATEADVGDSKTAVFLDRQGELVALPKHAIIPFARIAARSGFERIKRFHIGDTYRSSPSGGHPKSFHVAVFDIITADPSEGVSEAETIGIISEILNIFPGLNNVQYEVHLSHSQICNAALKRLASDQRRNAYNILDNNKITLPQKRSLLSKLGLARTTVDEFELLLQVDDVESFMARLARTSFGHLLQKTFEEIRTTIRFASILGVKHRILLRPWLGNHDLFKDGILFEVTKGLKRSDVIASGGRYDHLLAKYRPPTSESSSPHLRATGVQIAVDKITYALAAHQRNSIKTLLKEKKSYGLWSPRRCDVYITSHSQGSLAERLEIVALLWQNEVSADLMYDSAVGGSEDEILAMAQREGILFLVYHRSGSGGRQPWRIKSVLRGTEQDVLRHELVFQLQALIQEQRRLDKSQDMAAAPPKVKEMFEVPLVLSPDDTNRKQRQTTKNIYQMKANAVLADIKEAAQAATPPVIGVDVSAGAWSVMTASPAWVTQEHAWKALLEDPHIQREVLVHLRDQILHMRRTTGTQLIYLFSLRDEKLHMYHLDTAK